MKRVLIGIGAALLTVGALAGVGRAAYEAGRDDARHDTNVQVADASIDSPSNAGASMVDTKTGSGAAIMVVRSSPR